MLALFVLASFALVGYLIYTSPVTPEELKEMLGAEDWF